MSENTLLIKTVSPNSSLKININEIPAIKISFDNFILEDTPIWSEDFEEYSIMPNATEDLILSTNNKKMINNIIFHKIPYAEVSNSAGGITVSINS